MKQFSILHPVLLTFYSKELYREVGRHWKGIAAGYLFLLMLLAAIPDALNARRSLGEFLQDEAPALVAQLPVIKIQNGELETDPPGRHEIVDPKTKQVAMILDSTVETAPADLPENLFFITKKEMVITQRTGMTRRVPLSQIGDRTITQDDAMGFFEMLRSWVPPFWFVCVVVGSFVGRLLQALLYGAIGTMIAGSVKASLDYAALVRTAVMAITPVVVVETILEIARVSVPWYILWPAAIAVAIYYMMFGIKAAAEKPAAAGAVGPPIG